MSFRLIIFDFDGVVADSELIANSVLAEFVSDLGEPISVEEAMRINMGRHWPDVACDLETRLGRALPEDFAVRRRAVIMERFSRELQAVRGAREFIAAFEVTERCIASSSTVSWISHAASTIGMLDLFEGRIFTAESVARGKPFPDLFLHAAASMGVAPEEAVVIEDSLAGVAAGVAAGMRTIGLCAGCHIRPGHAEALREAGATLVVDSYMGVAEFLRTEASFGMPAALDKQAR